MPGTCVAHIEKLRYGTAAPPTCGYTGLLRSRQERVANGLQAAKFRNMIQLAFPRGAAFGHLVMGCLTAVVLGGSLTAPAAAETEPSPPSIQLKITPRQVEIDWAPFPAIEQYRILSTTNLNAPLAEDKSGIISGFGWRTELPKENQFYRLEAVPLSSNALLTATLLNRLAYGPTPDELERILTGPDAIGAEAYIEEQLAPELITETLDVEETAPDWIYVTATGTATSGRFYIYLSGAGTVHIDDVKLVAGTIPESGMNLLGNGDFESDLTGPWTVTSNFTNSFITTEVAKSGIHSLQVVATAGGSGSGNAIWQAFSPFSSSQQYTLSFWYLPNTNTPNRTLTVRLSGSQTTVGVPTLADESVSSIYARLTKGTTHALIEPTANLADLRAWYVHHAVGARRQLLEVLTQFLENHFVTQHSKSVDFLDAYYNDFSLMDRLATNFEFREISRWRDALLNPSCTFHDLLRISAESPAMIIYLDTATSRGDGGRIANENYARELFELFTMGVDNGYDQEDIVEMSRVWTGWTVDILDFNQINNPHAPRTTNQINFDVANSTARSNLFGAWTFRYRPERHSTTAKTIFPGKSVPARFGLPYTTNRYANNTAPGLYELRLPARTGTSSIQDGYQSLALLADLPFTQEYLSVKLCRWFIHDDFHHGYDFTDPNLSPEGRLVRECMRAWESSSPKGQIRPVLRTIFNSELFLGHGASMQKVKTPLEFSVSAVRALRSANPDGTYTAMTDGYSISGRSRTSSSAPLTRMGGMMLFDRDDPDGYPESAGGWISAGTLAERIRFIQTMCMAYGESGRTDGISGGNNNTINPVALLKKSLPPARWNDSGAIADYFLGILFPGEGKANLDLYRTAAINFLNSSDDGVFFSSFGSLSHTSAAYNNRVRGMVAMLMSSQRFQEQ
jgi:uncharacterized protein (DUF1800 family)